MEEVWKDIKSFEGLYQVSNMGRVKSLDRWVDRGGKPKCALWKGRVLKNKKASDNYYSVVLSKDNITKCIRVHRLVAEAFVPNPNNYTEVNHKDENKLNNRADNLEWCDRAYNVHYGTARERATKTLLKTNLLKKKTSFLLILR